MFSGQSIGGSPGECIDKVARQLGDLGSEFDGVHPGAAVEIFASRASPDGHNRYPIFLPSVPKADMNFDQIKGSYLNLLERIRKSGNPDVDIPDFCASLQVFFLFHSRLKLNFPEYSNPSHRDETARILRKFVRKRGNETETAGDRRRSCCKQVHLQWYIHIQHLLYPPVFQPSRSSHLPTASPRPPFRRPSAQTTPK